MVMVCRVKICVELSGSSCISPKGACDALCRSLLHYCLKAAPSRITTQRISRFMPVPQYPAVTSLAIDLMQMMLLPVGMAVDQTRVVMGAKQRGYRCQIHIHYVHSFGLLLIFAHFAQLLDLRFAL